MAHKWDESLRVLWVFDALFKADDLVSVHTIGSVDVVELLKRLVRRSFLAFLRAVSVFEKAAERDVGEAVRYRVVSTGGQ